MKAADPNSIPIATPVKPLVNEAVTAFPIVAPFVTAAPVAGPPFGVSETKYCLLV